MHTYSRSDSAIPIPGPSVKTCQYNSALLDIENTITILNGSYICIKLGKDEDHEEVPTPVLPQ